MSPLTPLYLSAIFMANKLKKKAPPPPDPDKLKPEKEVLVTVKEECAEQIAGQPKAISNKSIGPCRA